MTDRGFVRSKIARLVLRKRIEWLTDRAAYKGSEPFDVRRERIAIEWVCSVLKMANQNPERPVGDILDAVPFDSERDLIIDDESQR